MYNINMLNLLHGVISVQYPYEIRTCGPSNVKSVVPLNERIDYFNITTVYTGTLHYIVDEKDYLLKKGDTLIIRPGSHRTRYADEKPAHYFAIDYFSDGSEEESLPDFISGCSNTLKDTIGFLDKVHKNRNTDHYDLKCSLAVHLYLLTLKDDVKNSRLSFHVQQILKYISEHFTEPIKLDAIADYVHLTVPYCCHLVKKELGTTIYEIILHERITVAKDYLTSGEVPLSEIPYMCGFNDYSHFYKTFKKYTGISPSKFK